MSQITLPLPTAVSYAAADYVTGDSNRALPDALLQPDKWNSHGCLLIGPAASGKTHLAHIWREHFGALYIEASSLTSGDLPQDAYIVAENIDAKNMDINALFHMLNAVRESGRKLLLTASSEPKHFISLPDVLSRLNALFTLHIPPPDEALMQALLHKLFADRQLRVESDVIAYILTRAERSYASLQTLISRLDRSALIRKQGITIPLARQVLESGVI